VQRIAQEATVEGLIRTGCRRPEQSCQDRPVAACSAWSRGDGVDGQEHRQWLAVQEALAHTLDGDEAEPMVEAHGLGLGVGDHPDASFATEAAQRIVDEAVQIAGGVGVVVGHPVERLYRSVRALRIYEGATEIHRLIIADALMAARGPS
jgi:hypothetical protein